MIHSTTITHRGKAVRTWYFDTRFFDYKGETYEIVATKVTGDHPHEVVHTIKKGSSRKQVSLKRLATFLDVGGEKPEIRKPYKD